MFRESVLSQSAILLSSRSAKPTVLVEHLLAHGKVLDAMSICSRLGPPGLPDGSARIDLPALGTRKMEDNPFFHASIHKARQMDPEKACHIFNTLHSFVSLHGDGGIQAAAMRLSHRRCRSFDSLVDAHSVQIVCRRSSLGDITEKAMCHPLSTTGSGRKYGFGGHQASSNNFESLLRRVAPKGIREGIGKVYGLCD